MPDMQKVDGLCDWCAEFALTSYGIRIGVRSNDSTILPPMIEALPGEWKRSNAKVVDRLYSIRVSGRPRRYSHLYANDVRVPSSLNAADLQATLDSDLRIFIAEFARRRVFVHAGVVGWKGRAIVIPGRSFSGKSTLVAELIRAGATYYSDEYAVFDSRGRVHPFPKPLELRPKGSFTQSRVDVDALGGSTGTTPLPVGLVLMTRYREGARWRPRRLTAGKTVLELLFNTVSARRYPKQALETLERVAAGALVLRGSRGEAGNVVPAVLKRIDSLEI